MAGIFHGEAVLLASEHRAQATHEAVGQDITGVT